jgi:hypothetical protein
MGVLLRGGALGAVVISATIWAEVVLSKRVQISESLAEE